MRYTKGPWYYSGDSITHRQFDIYAPFSGNAGIHTHICTVNNLPHHILIGRKPENAEATARLIAAAPDMLEALKLALTGMHEPDAIIDKIEQAINKAEGK